MVCQCGKTALYRVGVLGFCREHYQVAVQLRQSQNYQQSEAKPVDFEDVHDRRPRKRRGQRTM